MDVRRRTFIAGAVSAAGMAAAVSAQDSASRVRPTEPGGAARLFGPNDGQALLSRNENPYGPSPTALRAISDTASKGCYYADRGVARLTDMIAERHGVSPDQVVLGSGSTEILSAIALAWGKDGTILCPGLFWDTTVQYGERQGTQAMRIPLAKDMNVDIAAMSTAFDDSISLVHICNPNNPTGMVVPSSEMRRLAAQVTPRATLLVDEAYMELADDPEGETVLDLVKRGQDVIVCRTFSKIYGMAGMRVGYAITTPENAERIRGYLMSFGGNVSGLAGAIASYDDYQFLDRSRAMILEGREMILEAVKQSGLRALPSQTNFVYVEVPDADMVQKAMADQGILIRGAYGPWTQYSRVSTGKLEDVSRYADALPRIMETMRA